MNDKIIKKTQDTLGKVIKKPPLTEKLLTKPPFRFLHDIMTSIIKTTGFMKGLYAENEMSSDNVKDKESKIAFLQKSIDMVSLVMGKPVSARPSKVVAGHEPEKTNEFLQMLAEACNKKVDNAEYVERVLKGDSGGGGGGGKKEKEKPPTGSREKRDGSADRRKRKEKEEDGEKGHRSKREDRDKDKEDRKDRGKSRDRDRDKDREKDRDRDRDRSKDRQSSKDRDGEKDKDKERRHRRDRDSSRDRGGDKDKDRDRDRERRKRRDKEAEPEEAESPHVNGDGGDEKVRKKPTAKASPKMSPRLSSKQSPKQSSPARGVKPKGKDQAPKTSGANSKLPPSPKGPPRGGIKMMKKERRGEKSRSRRRADPDSDVAAQEEEEVKEERPPKKREETTMNGHVGDDEVAPPPPPENARGRSRMARPSSARPAPPRVKKSEPEPQEVHIVGQSNAPNVIVDKKGDDSDDDDDDFITKEEEVPLTLDEPPPPPSYSDPVDEEGGEHGGLVKKILETKKELEGGSLNQQGKAKKTEIERSQVTDATKRKEREMVQKEIDKLRAAIQLLTRSANPLGKIMDFVQEDLDSMQKELEMWTRENKENMVALQREERITESSIEPLKAQLTELDAAINDQLDVIAAVKANIIRNDDKIEKMLSTTTKS